MDRFLQVAVDEARRGLAEGGIQVGSVLVIGGRIVGRGGDRRVQKGSVILHGEMECGDRSDPSGSAVDCVLYT